MVPSPPGASHLAGKSKRGLTERPDTPGLYRANAESGKRSRNAGGEPCPAHLSEARCAAGLRSARFGLARVAPTTGARRCAGTGLRESRKRPGIAERYQRPVCGRPQVRTSRSAPPWSRPCTADPGEPGVGPYISYLPPWHRRWAAHLPSRRDPCPDPASGRAFARGVAGNTGPLA